MTSRRPARSGLTRRALLEGGALALPALAANAVAPYGFARSARPSALDRVTVGIIGCGGMGRANMNSFQQLAGAQVVAVCDVDANHAAAAREQALATYAGQSDAQVRRGTIDVYADYRELLARTDIDAVVVATPDHWHGLNVVHAVKAGKDVYGEKPLSLTIGQGRAMSDAVTDYGRVFQTGSQQRSDARFRRACELVRNGRLGEVRKVTCVLHRGSSAPPADPVPVPDGFDYDFWLGPAPAVPYVPNRAHYVFRHQYDYSGGIVTDWGAHHIDIAHWALGLETTGPIEVSATGTFPSDGPWNAPLTFDITARYRTGVEFLITSEGENGITFEGDEGTLFVSRGRIDATPAGILDSEIRPTEHRYPVSPGHHQDFLDRMQDRRQCIAPIEHAHRTITVAHLGNIALRTGRPVPWDPDRETTTDAIAERLLDRRLRGEWSL
ncbi:Inositol 2-dehydrogenase/D-chiro-inositol 3-dehydrogenase [Planctomycetes bacterium Pla163]|uniref:Inositol 2-dehydrogenase/D-chiro-inositol 3-dehydrogenase n=1 Tax=Rohdeia mirabilis TaxID=2528008 RepID=A0A518D465_9BACT|nr:Inositol 2-dehydrogenase/D-chiro-inositol 3-dehydrogenase [Planctomycetes bacterium Pla163]